MKKRDHPLMAATFFGKCWALLPAKLDEILALAEAVLAVHGLDKAGYDRLISTPWVGGEEIRIKI
jgi:hypothetical protein